MLAFAPRYDEQALWHAPQGYLGLRGPGLETDQVDKAHKHDHTQSQADGILMVEMMDCQ